MFDIGWSELLLIGIVALVVIGPKDLPKVLRAVGTMMSKVRSMASEFQGQFQDAMREAELSDLKKEAEKLAATAKGTIENPMQSIRNEVQQALEAPAQNTPPPSASDAQVDAVIPAPPQAEPVSIEPASIAPPSATSAETPAEPARKQGSGA